MSRGAGEFETAVFNTTLRKDFKSYLIKFVSLAKFHRLLPAIVSFEQVRRYTPELNQLVFLEPLSQGNVVEIIKSINAMV